MTQNGQLRSGFALKAICDDKEQTSIVVRQRTLISYQACEFKFQTKEEVSQKDQQSYIRLVGIFDESQSQKLQSEKSALDITWRSPLEREDLQVTISYSNGRQYTIRVPAFIPDIDQGGSLLWDIGFITPTTFV